MEKQLVAEKIKEKTQSTMDLLDSQGLLDQLIGCLEDTYESNQIKALNLLSSVSSEQLHIYMTEERVKALLAQAFDYMYSSRTQDSMAAAYLLQAAFTVPQKALHALQTLPCMNIIGQSLAALSLDDVPTDSERLSLMLAEAIINVIHDQASQAREDLVQASQEAPLYPAILCLRYILSGGKVTCTDKWTTLVSSLFRVTFDEVYPLVCPVVCHSSPEGYLPPSQNEEQENKDAGDTSERPGLPQYLVVCCWRTVKEISLVYASLMEGAHKAKEELLTSEQILNYIKVFYESILLNAKHRGAFEMAYTGYCSYWKTIWRLKSCQGLVEQFLTDSPYSMLLQRESADQLCATRRSAGLPFMVQAYLTAEPRLNNNASFVKIMNQLLPISIYLPADGEEYSSAQRVHALNVLRAIYKNSNLGDAVQPFISQGLKSAVKGYKSENWPVRNAATLLFSSLITRMFGVKHGKDDLSKQSGMAGRLFFQKYPEIHPFFVEELESCTSFVDSTGQTLLQPSLYLLLIVLCKMYPSQKEAADSMSLEVFVQYLHRCASSPVYKARMLAALALANIVDHDSMLNTLRYLCSELSLTNQNNRLHGLLLQIFHLYGAICNRSGFNSISSDVSKVIFEAVTKKCTKILDSRCDLVKSVYIDLLRVTKDLLYSEYEEEIVSIFRSTLLNTFTSFSTGHQILTGNSQTEQILSWLGDSVDLQLSRCRLLLSPSKPCLYDKDNILEALLDSAGMYEVHHVILSNPSVQSDCTLLRTEFLASLFCSMLAMNDQDFSFNRATTIDQIADILAGRVSPSLNNDLASKVHFNIALTSESMSLPLVRLNSALLCCKPESASSKVSLSDTLEQVLDHIKSDTSDNEGLRKCLDIVRCTSYTVLRTETSLSIASKFWQICIALIYAMDDEIRSETSNTVCEIVSSHRNSNAHIQAGDPNTTFRAILLWMRDSGLYETANLQHIWRQWLSGGQIWSSSNDTAQDADGEDRLFSKAEGQLLSDPQSSFSILTQLYSQIS